MKISSCLLVAVCCVIASGCASGPPVTRCMEPADGLSYCLQDPGSLRHLDGESRLVTVITPQESRQDLLFTTAFHHASLLLDASSLLGQPLFLIRHDANGVTVTPAGRFDRPAWLVGLLQLAYLPVNAVQPYLRGARIEETRVDEHRRERSFVAGDTVIMKVVYSPTVDIIRLPSDIEVRIAPVDIGSTK